MPSQLYDALYILTLNYINCYMCIPFDATNKRPREFPFISNIITKQLDILKHIQCKGLMQNIHNACVGKLSFSACGYHFRKLEILLLVEGTSSFN